MYERHVSRGRSQVLVHPHFGLQSKPGCIVLPPTPRSHVAPSNLSRAGMPGRGVGGVRSSPKAKHRRQKKARRARRAQVLRESRSAVNRGVHERSALRADAAPLSAITIAMLCSSAARNTASACATLRGARFEGVGDRQVLGVGRGEHGFGLGHPRVAGRLVRHDGEVVGSAARRRPPRGNPVCTCGIEGFSVGNPGGMAASANTRSHGRPSSAVRPRQTRDRREATRSRRAARRRRRRSCATTGVPR